MLLKNFICQFSIKLQLLNVDFLTWSKWPKPGFIFEFCSKNLGASKFISGVKVPKYNYTLIHLHFNTVGISPVCLERIGTIIHPTPWFPGLFDWISSIHYHIRVHKVKRFKYEIHFLSHRGFFANYCSFMVLVEWLCRSYLMHFMTSEMPSFE